jgi:hypothetical protein
VKKVIMILGYIFLALMILLLAGIGSLTVIGNRLDKESKAFVDAAIPAIVSTWDISEIEKRASPEFNDEVDYDGLEQDFGVLQQLGNLVMYKGSTGDAHITLSFQYGYEITADYTASANFEAGSTSMRMSLIKHGGQWQILEFKIDPEELSGRIDII